MSVDEVVEFWKTQRPRSRPEKKERRLIKARLEDYSVEDLCHAIEGIHRSPYHCGENESGTKYLSLELVVRDNKHVDQFVEIYENPPSSQSATEQRSQRAIQNWLEGDADTPPLKPP